MGGRQSQPAAASPSAAFGRVRISTPRASKIVSNSLRVKARGALSGVDLRKLAMEDSPLLERHLATLESSISDMVAPPVAVWIGPALICALMYALYNIFIKKGSASINPILGGVILQFVAATCGTLLLVILTVKEGTEETMQYDKAGVWWAVMAGVAVGAAEILSFIVSGMGVQSMQSIPIIIGGSVLFGTVLGATVLHEVLTYKGWFGVFLIAVGIGLVGTDPGGAGGVHG
jgi:transporter family protein